jgi:hypothetical protein
MPNEGDEVKKTLLCLSLLFLAACNTNSKPVETEECDAYICISPMHYVCSITPEERSQVSITVKNNKSDGSTVTYSSSIIVDDDSKNPNKADGVKLGKGESKPLEARALKRVVFTISSQDGKTFERSFVRSQNCESSV